VHGNVFKQPNISQDKVDDLANVFLIGTDISDLPTDQQNQARNLTREIFVVQQADLNVTINFANDVAVEPDASGGVINAVSDIRRAPKQWNLRIMKLTHDMSPGRRSSEHTNALSDHRRG
jgi:hypothetical protein